jgi:hypothetical protein
MLTNVGRVRGSENIIERRENLCFSIEFYVFYRNKKENHQFASKIIEDYCTLFDNCAICNNQKSFQKIAVFQFNYETQKSISSIFLLIFFVRKNVTKNVKIFWQFLVEETVFSTLLGKLKFNANYVDNTGWMILIWLRKSRLFIERNWAHWAKRRNLNWKKKSIPCEKASEISINLKIILKAFLSILLNYFPSSDESISILVSVTLN